MSKIIKLNDFRETKIEDLPILGIDELDLCMNEVAFMTMYHEYLNRGGSEEVFKTCQANYISDISISNSVSRGTIKENTKND